MSIRTAQEEEETIEFFIMANPETGESEVYLKDGQNLGKACSKILDKLAPGAGETGHSHMDWTSGHGPDDKERVRERQVANQ